MTERGSAFPRTFFRLAFWLPLAVCTWLALVPEPPDNPVFRLSDVILHGAAFTYLSLALVLALLDRGGRPAYVKTFVLMLGYGALLELVQSFVPERSAELKDLLVDGAGIAAGLVLARLLAGSVHETLHRVSARL